MSKSRFSTFHDLVQHNARTHGERVFLPRRHGKDPGDDPVSFAGLAADVERLAAGLIARGLERGDRIALISENRYEWLLCDLASACVGLVDVPRGTDTAVEELRFILGHSECRFAFVETPAVAKELDSRRAELPKLESICVMTGAAEAPAASLAEVSAEGVALLAERPDAVQAAAAEIGADDLQTIVYTSGTTANPKGVMLTHANLLSNMAMVEEVLDFGEADVFLSVLPAWHAYERIMDYVAMQAGSQLVYSDRRHLKEDLAKVRPTVFAAVPRIWESIHDGMRSRARKMKGLKRKLLTSVLDNCRRIGSGRATMLDRICHRLAGRTILPKLLAATGGRLRIAVSGGGSLPLSVDECLLGIGLPIINGYGLTETSPCACVRLPESNRAGTIGPPLPNTEIEIRDFDRRALPNGETGLIWIRGPQVMRGYYANRSGTDEVLQNGWFNSGDLGYIEPDGQIRVTGRAKDTIVLSGGENVEPERIELQLKMSPLIDQAIVVGQDRKSLGALFVPDLEWLEERVPRAEWDEHAGLLRSRAVHDCFRAEVDALLSRENGFRPLERIPSFRVVVEPLSIENGMLTQTLKIKRHKVCEKHGKLIEEMFA